MKICVVGGAGFIGSHLVDTLLELGHEVVVIDNLVTGSREFVAEEAIFYEVDIRDQEIRKIFKEHKFDYVFHEAAQTMVTVSMEDPIYDCDVNLMGLLNILEACKETGVKKIIMPSSAAVYGDLVTLPLSEEMQGKPTSFYGLTKLTTESYLELYRKNFNLPYICLRYSNVYGPRQGNSGEGGVVSIFCKLIKENKNLTIFGDGEQTRDFIYVKDVVDANIACLNNKETVGIFNVSTNKSISINELAKYIIEYSKNKVDIIYKENRKGDIKHSRLDNSKSQRVLKWKAETSIKDGIKQTVNYFMEDK